jgi:hypothetical protein
MEIFSCINVEANVKIPFIMRACFYWENVFH